MFLSASVHIHARKRSFDLPTSLLPRPEPRCSYLIQAARSAVLPAGGQVPELHVQQVDELDHGGHGVRDVTGVQVVPGVLRQLPRDVGGHLPRLHLQGRKQRERLAPALSETSLQCLPTPQH